MTWRWTAIPLGYRCIYFGGADSPIRKYSKFHSIESPDLRLIPVLTLAALGLGIASRIRRSRSRRADGVAAES
jgi:hypothetical protein